MSSLFDKDRNIEIGTGHILRWLFEDENIVEFEIEHFGCPYKVEGDADGKLAWQGGHYECAIQFLEDYIIEDYFEEFMRSKGEGEHEVKFKYTYHYHPPTYPDYEPDYDFEWEPEDE
jgi:hypothetical protein